MAEVIFAAAFSSNPGVVRTACRSNALCFSNISLPGVGGSISDGILHRGVEVLQRLIVLHLSEFDILRVATGAGFTEFPKTARQFAIGIIQSFEVQFGKHLLMAVSFQQSAIGKEVFDPFLLTTDD